MGTGTEAKYSQWATRSEMLPFPQYILGLDQLIFWKV
jgi:hypothetical protein